MRRGSRRPSGRRVRITRIAWGLASMLFFFTAENIWIDPWLRSTSHPIPSLVPEALSAVWFLVFAIGGIALTLLAGCQILLIRDRTLPVWKKMGTGIAVLVVLLMSVEWCRVTNGLPPVLRLETLRKRHTVTLTWKASSSQVAGYHVYRSTTPGANYVRMNSSLVERLTFTDTKVDSGVTYYYVTRAVDAQGYQSANSNEASAAIPYLW